MYRLYRAALLVLAPSILHEIAPSTLMEGMPSSMPSLTLFSPSSLLLQNTAPRFTSRPSYLIFPSRSRLTLPIRVLCLHNRPKPTTMGAIESRSQPPRGYVLQDFAVGQPVEYTSEHGFRVRGTVTSE